MGGGACAATGDPVSEACLDLYLSELRLLQVWAGLCVCSATDLLREVCRSLCGWRDPRGRRISRPRSPFRSFPHGVAAAAGLHSAPSPGAQSAARRTPRERFAGLSGTEISLAPIFRGVWVQNSPWVGPLSLFCELWVRSYVYVRLSTPPSWLRPRLVLFSS